MVRISTASQAVNSSGEQIVEISPSSCVAVNDYTSQLSLSNIDGKITACDTTNLATSANQYTSIGLLSSMDSALNGTLTVDGSVSVSNNSDPATSTKQDQQIAQTLNKNGYAQVLLTSTNGTLVKADTSLTVQNDPEKREGWNCINPISGTKLNLYFFSGSNEIITLGELSSVYFKGFINKNTEFSSLPFINVYTKPTGSGDASWYHSRITYEYNNDNTIGIGEECVFFGKGIPSTEFNNRKIQLNNVVVDGEGLDTEEILYIVVSTNSLATQDAVDTTLNIVGFNTSTIRRNLVLTTEPVSGTVVSGSNNNHLSSQSVTSAYTSSGFDVSSASRFSIMGNTTDNSNSIIVEFSPDNTNWYRANTELYPSYSDFSSPYDFYTSFEGACVKYVRLNFANYTGTETVNCTILTQ